MNEEVIYTNNIKAVQWLRRFFAAYPHNTSDLPDAVARQVVISLARGDDPERAAAEIAGRSQGDEAGIR